MAQAADGKNIVTTGVATDNAAAGAAALAHSTGASSQLPPEGGGLQDDDRVTPLEHQFVRLQIRAEVQAEERDRAEAAQMEKQRVERLERF